MNELLKPFKDDRIKCGDCQYFGKRKWGGRCENGNVYYVDTLHRCEAFVANKQQSKDNTWNEGETPFWL